MSDPRFYDNGLDQLGGNNWENVNFYFLLADGYTFDPTHVYVADIDPGSVEVVNPNYSRAGAGGLTPTRVVNYTDHRVEYHCDDVGYGVPDSGSDVSSMILYRLVSDDTDSPLVACFEIDPPRTTDGFAFTVPLPATGVAYTTAPP